MRCFLARSGDHPRMRGEHSLQQLAKIDDQGSSPHARGAPISRSLVSCNCGIIPACAGSTLSYHSMANFAGDHPRMRGEHASSSDFVWSALGSSPHARGAHTSKREEKKLLGIIPACAGSTQTGATWGRAHGDHPRMRGEHLTRKPRVN